MNPTSKTIEQTMKRVINSYTDNANILGMFVIGSAANNSMDEYSDIDLLCVVDNPHGEPSRESFTDVTSGIDIEVLYNTKKELEQYLQEENTSTYRTVAYMICGGRILIDKDRTLNDLVAKAKQILDSKTKTTVEQSVMIRYSIEDFMSDANREFEASNFTVFNMYCEKIINNVIEASVRKHNGYFKPPKQLLNFIENSDPTLLKLINQFYLAENINKLSVISSISEYGLALLGGRLDNPWKLER